jgi:hypothetical protein
VIDEHQISIDGSHGTGNFLQLAFADERGRIRTVTVLNEFAGNFRAGGSHQFAELGQRFFHAYARDTFLFRTFRRYIARKHGVGRNWLIAIGTGAVTELQSNEKRPLRTITTSLDPGRRLKTAGTLPRNKLALRLAGTAVAFCRGAVRTAVKMAAFGHYHGRDGVFENELFLIVGFKDD